jgi:protein-disulfide isomerase-like protein with CxxC motif
MTGGFSTGCGRRAVRRLLMHTTTSHDGIFAGDLIAKRTKVKCVRALTESFHENRRIKEINSVGKLTLKCGMTRTDNQYQNNLGFVLLLLLERNFPVNK